MNSRTLTLVVAALAAQTAYAAAPARTMYMETLAREQAVRAVLTADGALATILTDVRAVVASYESLVAHYPASGYSDNALWQAGCLSLDAYARFRQPQDRDSGLRLLKRLAVGYPSSKLVKDVAEQLARVDDVRAPRPIATIKDIRRSVTPESVRVTIELDGEASFHDEHIADPERVFVDLAGTRAGSGLVDRTLRFESDADVVRQVRIGRHPNSLTRVVLDAAGISSYSVYPLYSPFRIVIDCVRAPKTAAVPTRAADSPPVPARRVTIDGLRPLQERPVIANREGAELFLSIHANASPHSAARGIETYFLNFANNPNAAQVAARENAASALTMGALPDFVKAIALNNKVDESRDFAAQIQRAMIARLRSSNKSLKDLGVKQAPFIVLIGATMPSVLAEVSFVTNPQEAKLLKGNVYRQRIAEALFNAIRKYQTSLKPAATAVAHQ